MKTTPIILLEVLVNVGLGAWLGLACLEGTLDERATNYSRVEDWLYVGGDVARPPRGTKAVLNLCEKEDAYRADVAVYLWEAIPDAAPGPDIDWLRRAVDFLDAQRQAGRQTYVHCRNGVSRSALVVVAYEMSKNHWGRDQALNYVKERRPIIRPNAAFMGRLAEWERVVLND
jgi:hypothetical protein